MKRFPAVFVCFLFATTLQAQIVFEKGYFVDDTDRKVNCQIRFVDEKNTPQYFDYKLSDEGEIRRGGTDNVKEFTIDGIAKYVRATVDIDRSSQEVEHLTADRNPVFSKETLFLNQLVAGEATLYSYSQNLIIKYYYQKGGDEVTPLVYKAYKTKDNRVAYNIFYKQQLLDALICDDISRRQVESLRYYEKDLEKLFVAYNKCKQSAYTVFDGRKKKREIFHLSLRPRASFTSATAELSTEFYGFSTDYGSKVGYGLGLEAEIVLPFNRNKWSVTIEPTLLTPFKGKSQIEKEFLRDRDLFAEIKYKPVEIPIGARYYMFLNNNTRIFVNAAYVICLKGNSGITFSGSGSSFYSNTSFGPTQTFALGTGVKVGKRLSLEARYQFPRDASGSLQYWNVRYRSASVVAGISIF